MLDEVAALRPATGLEGLLDGVEGSSSIRARRMELDADPPLEVAAMEGCADEVVFQSIFLGKMGSKDDRVRDDGGVEGKEFKSEGKGGLHDNKKGGEKVMDGGDGRPFDDFEGEDEADDSHFGGLGGGGRQGGALSLLFDVSRTIGAGGRCTRVDGRSGGRGRRGGRDSDGHGGRV